MDFTDHILKFCEENFEADIEKEDQFAECNSLKEVNLLRNGID